jgi:hypothetical protein
LLTSVAEFTRVTNVRAEHKKPETQPILLGD